MSPGRTVVKVWAGISSLRVSDPSGPATKSSSVKKSYRLESEQFVHGVSCPLAVGPDHTRSLVHFDDGVMGVCEGSAEAYIKIPAYILVESKREVYAGVVYLSKFAHGVFLNPAAVGILFLCMKMSRLISLNQSTWRLRAFHRPSSNPALIFFYSLPPEVGHTYLAFET